MPKVVDRQERRAELAAAAANVIARHGVGAATMRDVAAEAGWTTGALTHYFADKRELLLFTFRASLDGRHAAHEAVGTQQPLDALTRSLEGALPLDDDRRRHWMVTMACCTQSAGDPELAEAQRDAYRDFRGRIAGLSIAAGVVPAAQATELAEQLIAMADGLAVQALFDPDSWPPALQLRRLHDAIEVLLPTGGAGRGRPTVSAPGLLRCP